VKYAMIHHDTGRLMVVQRKDQYQDFWGVLIDLIVEILVLIFKTFDN
jgi:hypothetical protein